MNIYFACSITGGRDFEYVYQMIVKALTGDGHEVPTAHLAKASAEHISVSAEAFFNRTLNKVLFLDQ